MYLLDEISSFLREDLGLHQGLSGLQPLAQWVQPTAFRVFLESDSALRSLIVKHIPDSGGSSLADLWQPRWKIAQDYINLCFLQEICAGAFAPQVHGYSEERNMLAIQDLGGTSLWEIENIPALATHNGVWREVARALGRLVACCPPDPERFQSFARAKRPDFTPLRKWQDQDPNAYHSIVSIAREMDFGHVPELEAEVARLVALTTEANRWVAYSVGDLWPQHVMFHEGCVKFIDFHCGGYDIATTDLMRLVDGSPLYRDRPLPQEIITDCKDAFFAELSGARDGHLDCQEFEEVYDFTLVRHVVFMVAREVLQLRRVHLCDLVTKAVRAARLRLESTEHARAITMEFLAELEELPNKRLNGTR